MIQILDGMFAKSNSASGAGQAAIRALMNTRMTGESVRRGSLHYNDGTSQLGRSNGGKTRRENAN